MRGTRLTIACVCDMNEKRVGARRWRNMTSTNRSKSNTPAPTRILIYSSCTNKPHINKAYAERHQINFINSPTPYSQLTRNFVNLKVTMVRSSIVAVKKIRFFCLHFDRFCFSLWERSLWQFFSLVFGTVGLWENARVRPE